MKEILPSTTSLTEHIITIRDYLEDASNIQPIFVIFEGKECELIIDKGFIVFKVPLGNGNFNTLLPKKGRELVLCEQTLEIIEAYTKHVEAKRDSIKNEALKTFSLSTSKAVGGVLE